MIGAIIRDNMVNGLIVVDEANVVELEKSLNCEIVDARPYGLTVGDLRTDKGWTRNAGGEQFVLELLEQEAYDGYSIAAAKVVELEEQNAALVEEQNTIAESVADEALAILTGKDDGE